MNTQRWALALGVELVFDPEQDKEVPCQSTWEAMGRRLATIAQKTCVQVAAAAQKCIADNEGRRAVQS